MPGNDAPEDYEIRDKMNYHHIIGKFNELLILLEF